MRKPKLVALLLAVATLALTACGQKGALFITTEEPAQASQTAPDAETGKPEKEGEMSQ